MIEESIQWEDITTINIYAPNIGTPKYIKQILLQKKIEIDSNTIIMGDFKLTSMDRSSRQKINKEKQALDVTLGQMGLISIQRAFQPMAAEQIFFSSAQETFSRIDHRLGHKICLINLRKLKSYQASFLAIMIWD